MKKSVKVFIAVISVCIVAVIVVVLGLSGVFTRYDDNIDGEFDLYDERYQYIINIVEPPYQENVGSVMDAATARKEAVKIWKEIYGRTKIKGEKPYRVYYDAQNEVWLVCGSLKPGYLGGTAHILIEKEDGKIIAVWHEK